MKRALIYLSLSVALLFGGVALAQSGKDGSMAKLDHSLIGLHEQYAAHIATGSRAPFSTDDPLLNLVEDRVVIDVIADGDAEALKANLEQLGMQQAVAFGRVVSGQLPVSALPEAAALATLRFARTAAAMTHVGVVTSQGDVAQRSDVARTTLGVNGTGVKVGVLSDSYNSLGGAAADIASGDLPAAGVQVIQDSGTTDEGRAMLQIVHDVAPGASLAFATANGGQANFANNIIALKNAGANVIVDDVIYFAEPMFQDGIIAQAVDTVVASGAAYFSSAGNNARKAYEALFRNSGINLGSTGTNQIPSTTAFFAHDFDPGPGVDIFQTVTVPNGTTRFSFQWADRYFSVSGAPGAQTDLDVAVFFGGNFLFGFFSRNIGNDPIEVFSIVNSGSAAQVQFAIGKFAGSDPIRIKNVAFRTSFVFDEFATNSGTIFGHANAVGAEAVGAAAYNNTPAFGVSPPVLETFSSAGTTRIYFDTLGNPIDDPRADKPEITAPDGADTTFFGSSDPDGTGFPNFFGTSAAAPHAAGVAALLLQSKPTLIPAQIYGALESTAINMGVPGFDNDSGFGLIQADAALASLLPEVFIAATDNTATEQGTTTGIFTVSRTGSTASPLTVNYTVGGTATSGSDYVALSGSVVILSGQSSGQIVVTPIDDALSEGNETVIANLAAGASYTIGNPNSATVTIADNDAPDTIITSVDPGTVTNLTMKSFNFGSTVPGSTFECKIDTGAFTSCTSPKTYTKLKPGAHHFEVHAIANGIVDPTPATHDWTVDKTAPNTMITLPPPLLTNNPVATIAFSSDDSSATFQCSLDGGPFAPCSNPFVSGPLADGKHNFQVKAIDGAGNIDKSAAKAKAWTVDTTAPNTTIAKGPTNPSKSTNAAFKFKSSEKKSTFQCNLDSGGYTPCTGAMTFPRLSLGAHHLDVRAIDGAGNIDPTPAAYDWMIIP